MADVTVLVCACGMRLKAAGAVPGRVGKCPACGGLLRVPEAGPAGAGSGSGSSSATGQDGYAVGAPSASRRPSTFSVSRGRGQAPKADAGRPPWGLVRALTQPESTIGESLLYPLRGDSSLVLLLVMPPFFWFGSIPLLTWVLAGGPGGLGTHMLALLSLLPTTLVLLTVGGYTLLYLGRVLVTSALGDVHVPRWPEWDLFEMIRGLGRWLWALLTGAILGGLPAVAYWMYCGTIDPVDAIVLVELVAVGAVYAQVALLASILHDDPLGANPITVGLAIWRTGWGCVPPSLLIGTFVTVAAAGLVGVLEIESPPLAALAYWLYWVFLLYGALVILRVLGLFYHRHARLLGWFREHPRWGA